jgi:DNA-binding SARP family transcriptional activator/TolB-like protein
VLRLQTLGSVFLATESGEPLGGAAAQRRTLALLAALAIAGEGGLSRDKIVGLLWPETDPERARHSLTQALYAARRALKADDLFTVNADVRLNRRQLVCDVNELEAALDAGELERGVALYTGPFLDGFFLSGSPEFEQWSSLQRGRLEGRVVEALERLAEAAGMEDNYRRAAEWRKRISAIRPLDSGNTVKLMTALVETGDRAGALQHARVHELLLREQLDLDPDVTVLALATKLREPNQPIAADPRVHGTELERPVSEEVPSEGSSSPVGFLHSASIRRRLLTIWAPKKQRSSWRLPAALILMLAVLMLAVLTAAVTIIRGRREAPAAAQPQLRQKVVVAPFRVAGAASALGYLSDGIVELLSTRLADDTAARAVDPGAVLGAWESAGFTRAGAVPRDSVVKLAAQLGAERVVIGSVVGTPSRMILRASVVAVPSAQVSGEAMVEGPADSISALIDGLAAKLLVSQAGEDERLASYTTASLPALRAYLAGQAAFREDDYDGAIRRYEAALELDPRFALAALHLAMAADRRDDDEQRRRGVALAWTSRDALSERDLALLVAFGGPKYPMPSSALEQLAAWRRLADLAPNDAESWYTLGARLFHDGATAGVPGAESRTTATLVRALSIDSNHASAGLLLLHLATTKRSSSQLDDLVTVTDTAGAGPLKPFAPFLRWRIALARGDTAELRRVRGSLRRVNSFNLRAMEMASQFDGFGITDGAHAIEILGTRATRRTDRLDFLLAQHSRAVQQGRPQTALTFTTRLGAVQRGSHAHLRLRVLDALYAEGDSAAATAAARELGVLTSGGLAWGVFTFDTRLADLCVLSQWRVSHGDTAGVEIAIDALRRAGATMRQLPAVSAAPAACAELLDGWLAVLMRRGDALTRMERLDSLALTSQTAGDAITYAPILIARLYERLGQPGRALQAIRKRAYMSSWPRYLVTAWWEEGRLAQLVGDEPRAQEAYERYLAFRTSPEDELVPQVEQVRRLLAALPTRTIP